MAFLLCCDEWQLRQFARVHDAYQHVRKAFRVANLVLYVVEVRKNREIRRRIRLHDRRTVLHVLLDAAELEESALLPILRHRRKRLVLQAVRYLTAQIAIAQIFPCRDEVRLDAIIVTPHDFLERPAP